MTYARVREIHHDHATVRHHVARLQVALGSSLAPPDGHAFWGLLHEAAGHLTEALPGHFADEEADIFPRLTGLPGAEGLGWLAREHAAIAELLHEFSTRLAADGPPHAGWPAIRAVGGALVLGLTTHMEGEERLLGRLGRALAERDEAARAAAASEPLPADAAGDPAGRVAHG